MPLLVRPAIDQMNADKRRHPAIYAEAPSSIQQGEPRIDAIYLAQLVEIQRSAFFRAEHLYNHLRDQLSATATLTDGWDGYTAEPPAAGAIEAAERVLGTLRSLNAKPAAILPSSDGGIGICFNNGNRYGQLELLNDGEIHALLYGGEGGPQAWQVDMTLPTAIQETWKRIGAYL